VPGQIRSRAANSVGLHAFEYLFREVQGAAPGINSIGPYGSSSPCFHCPPSKVALYITGAATSPKPRESGSLNPRGIPDLIPNHVVGPSALEDPVIGQMTSN